MSKSDLLPIEKKVWQALQAIFPGRKTISLVIGVSGGPDSMCLLHVLHQLEIELHVVHINYQKRGIASDKDAKLVSKTAEKLGVDCKIIEVNPEEAEGQNFQQWARDVRYNAFEILAGQVDADGVAVAHHQDDQIETMLQKIFRGGGLASWSAMRLWNGQLFRPLLDVSRAEIEEYCAKNSIKFRHDESNFESDFARNFLRNEWLPELDGHFPGWKKNVLRVGEQAEVFAASLRFILQKITDKKDQIDRKLFLELDENLQKSVLLFYITQVDESAEVSRDALKELTKLQNLQTGKSLQLTENLELLRDRDYFKLVVDTDNSDIRITLKKEKLRDSGISFNGLEFSVQPYENPDFKRALYLDEAKISWPLTLRRWRKGDQFQPFGMQGHQSVAHHLTNRKVSAAEKTNALVLESFEESICAIIFPPIENRQPPGTISEMVTCGASTGACLIIKKIK